MSEIKTKENDASVDKFLASVEHPVRREDANTLRALMEEVSGAITTLFGTSAAACLFLGLVMFRKEQRDMLLNPMGHMQKEVHQDAIDKQGKGIWFGVILWIFALVMGSVIL